MRSLRVLLFAAALTVAVPSSRAADPLGSPGQCLSTSGNGTRGWVDCPRATIVSFGHSTSPKGLKIGWSRPFGSAAFSEDELDFPVPVAGRLGALYVRCRVAPTGAAQIYTLYKNAVATALTTTVIAGAFGASDIVHGVSVAEGDLIAIRIAGASAATVGGSDCSVSLRINGT